ncbi:MAG: hypothetical protein N2Z57_09655, partial [Oscillospiraceae bacterium]|nr:hypothetical protein [Oscillospiraceae bacterium]
KLQSKADKTEQGGKTEQAELRNKIESFYAYVSNVDINEESETLERKKDKLIEINKEIRKLEVRFSELKIMEKDRFPDYKRYHEIREYDIIEANDSLPEGMDQIVAKALSEYSNLLKKLGKNYIEIKSILSKNHSRIRDLINLTEHIIKIYDWTRENIFIDEEVFQLCK